MLSVPKQRLFVAPVSTQGPAEDGLTIQADYNPHEKGGEGQSEREDEDEHDDQRGALQYSISAAILAGERLTSSSTSTVPTE